MTRLPGDHALRPTLTLEETSRKRWDVLIAGAGPAGSVAARQLASRGVSVLLADKVPFPRWKVCGCCLNGAGLSALQTLGLGGLVQRLGAGALNEMILAVGASRAKLRLPRGAVVSRQALDAALIEEAIGAGAAFLPETEAVLLPGMDAFRKVRLRSADAKRHVLARLAIAADGLGGTFLRLADDMAPRVSPSSPIGAGAIFEDAPGFYGPGKIFMACGRGGYAGAVRLEDGRLDIAAALSRDRLRESDGIGAVLRDTFERCGFPCPDGMISAGWRGTPQLTRMRARLANHRMFVVGDSAGYVEPFTGEGMSWAIQAAMLLVPLVLEGLEQWSPALSEAWETRYRRFFQARRKVCVFIRELLRYRPPARAAVALLERAPWMASPWLKTLSSMDAQVRAIAGGFTR
jgi:flavin-dependent dehydrogenase